MLSSDVKILHVTRLSEGLALGVTPDVKFYATHPKHQDSSALLYI